MTNGKDTEGKNGECLANTSLRDYPILLFWNLEDFLGSHMLLYLICPAGYTYSCSLLLGLSISFLIPDLMPWEGRCCKSFLPHHIWRGKEKTLYAGLLSFHSSHFAREVGSLGVALGTVISIKTKLSRLLLLFSIMCEQTQPIMASRHQCKPEITDLLFICPWVPCSLPHFCFEVIKKIGLGVKGSILHLYFVL